MKESKITLVIRKTRKRGYKTILISNLSNGSIMIKST